MEDAVIDTSKKPFQNIKEDIREGATENAGANRSGSAEAPAFWVQTERLNLRPQTLAEMEAIRDAEPDPEMRKAYGEMIDLMRALPGQEEWGCDWAILLKDGTTVGGVGFKGVPDAEGRIEIGYGIDEPYRGQGYATEAVRGMVIWCQNQPAVRLLTAQTEPDNAISQKVLANCGFVRDGEGEEGPLFSIKMHEKS